MPPESETLVTLELFHGRLIEVHLARRFEAADYRYLLSHLRKLVERNGFVRMLLQLHCFEGWRAGARWEDLELDLAPLRKVDQLAIVGSDHCQAGLNSFLEPFHESQTRFFPLRQYTQSREWIDRGLARRTSPSHA